MSHFNRRQFIQLAACSSLLTPLLSNCLRPSSQTNAEDANRDRGVHWRQFAGTEISLLLDEHPWTRGIQPYLPAFEALTGIQLRLQIVPEPAYFQAIETVVRADPVQADVFFLPMDSTAYRLWQDSLLLPLTPLINNEQLTAPSYNLFDFPEGFRLAAMYPPEQTDKNLFGIPATFEAYILFYNKRLVNQYLQGEVPKTMAALIQAATQINQAGEGEVFGAVMRGVKSDAIIDTVTGIVLDSWGSDPTPLPHNLWFDGDWRRPRLNDPRIVAGLRAYAQLMQAGPSHIKTIDWPEATQLFRRGKAAFYIDASLFGPSYEDVATSAIAGDVGYATLPRFRQESLTGHWLWGLGIPRKTQHPEAAWMFIQWATSQHMEAKIAIATGGAPRFSSWLTPSVFTAAMNVDYALAVQTAMRTSRPTAVLHAYWSQIALAIADTLQQIYDGAEATAAVERLQRRVERTMALPQGAD